MPKKDYADWLTSIAKKIKGGLYINTSIKASELRSWYDSGMTIKEAVHNIKKRIEENG